MCLIEFDLIFYMIEQPLNLTAAVDCFSIGKTRFPAGEIIRFQDKIAACAMFSFVTGVLFEASCPMLCHQFSVGF